MPTNRSRCSRRKIACTCQLASPPISGVPGARRKGRVERVDIDAEIDRRISHDLTDAPGNGSGFRGVNILGADDHHAARCGPIVNLARHRRSDADLNHSARIDQALLDRMVEHRAVSVRLPETVGPGIDVRIEVNKRGRAPLFRQRAEQRKRDAVITTQGDEVFDLACLLLRSARCWRQGLRARSAKSPMSASGSFVASTRCCGCSPSTNIRLACRMAPGPKRAPLLLVVPRSRGIPAMQIGAARSRRLMPRNVGGTA